MSRTTDLEKELKKSAKRALTEKITASILLIVFGVILLVYTDAAVEIAVKILGVFFVICGAVLIVNFLMDRSGWRSVANVVLGTILIILGVWIFVRPQYLVAAFGIIAGAIIAANGVIDIKESVMIAKKGNKKWYVSLIIGLIAIALGLICIFKPWGVSNIIVTFVGVIMILTGVTDLVVIGTGVQTVNAVKQDLTAVDTTAKEIAHETAKETGAAETVDTSAPEAASDRRAPGAGAAGNAAEDEGPTEQK